MRTNAAPSIIDKITLASLRVFAGAALLALGLSACTQGSYQFAPSARSPADTNASQVYGEQYRIRPGF